MEVVAVRGGSYLNDPAKIDPRDLDISQYCEYMGLVIKVKVIQYLDGRYSKNDINDALSCINYNAFIKIDKSPLNINQKSLLKDIIKYELFLKNIDTDLINFEDVLSRF